MTSVSPFHMLLDEAWDATLRFDPLFATLTGDHRFNDRLPHVTPQAYAERLEELRAFRRRLETILPADLPESERLNRAVFQRSLDDEISELDFGGFYLPISKAGGFHITFPELFQFVPLDTSQDYDNYLARLVEFPAYVQEYIELMRAGLRLGFIPPKVTLEGVAQSLQAQIVEIAVTSPLYTPFEQLPDDFDAVEQERLRMAGEAAISGAVAPAYRALLAFLHNEYLPVARESIAAADLPDGAAFYEHRIRYFTSLSLMPAAIHQIGLDEVSRIRDEMAVVVNACGYGDDFPAFLEFMRSDAQFYATTPEQLLERTALVLKRADGELPRLFKTLPRMTYGIRPIPHYAAPGNTAAYYQPGMGDGTKAGMYYVNTYDLPSRPFYEIEALSLHEAVPGHHLQTARQMEMSELPMFRRYSNFEAYVEGWALYAERLGLEMGFYQDPYSNFGRLSYEMWRACRLVVDTGMHALGWTRQQAIDYMAENTSATLLNITNEIDRYIAWPGQALAYKLGELKIRELRQRAEDVLDMHFDLRVFHDVLLECGSLPLDVLEDVVQKWIDEKKAQAGLAK